MTVEIIREYLLGLNAPKVHLAHLEFRYQLLDKNFQVFLKKTVNDARTLHSVFEQRRAPAHYGGSPGMSAISFKMTMSQDGAPDMSARLIQSNSSVTNASSSNHTFNFPKIKLMEIWAFESFQLYVVYIQAPLGMTVSVSSGALFCQANEGKAMFFDGPPIDILFIDSMLVQLAEWHCQALANFSLTHLDSPKPHEKFRASIGDITLMITWNGIWNLSSVSHQTAQWHMHIELSGTDNIQYQNFNISTTIILNVLPDPKYLLFLF